MRTLRVLLSLVFLAVIVSFGLANRAKADEAAKCNCYVPNQQKYGVSPPPYEVCNISDNCFILLD